MTTIPASAIINVTPGVLTAGGDALDVIGLMLTNDTRPPIGQVLSFSSPDAIDAYFGPSSQMADLAAKYFNGFDDSSVKPGSLKVAQYPATAVGAFLRGGDLSALTLAQLQAFSGTLALTIDSSLKTASINLAAATSFSNAASIIGSTLAIQGPQIGTIVGSIAGGTMTVSSGSGLISALGVGNVLSGTGVTANTLITALLTGTGGAGTYSVSPSQAALSQTINVFLPPVTYDSVSGGFVIISPTTGASSTITYGSGALATSLKLTQALGAVISQGAAAAAPGAFMDAVTVITEDWATFMTTFDPDASGHTNKLAFASWTNDQNNRFAYVGWDTDLSPTTTVPATASLGYAITQGDYSGTWLQGGVDSTTGPQKAAMVCGVGASIDFTEANGRTDYAFRSQSGLVADVTTQTAADNLIANGYNFYGVYGTANDSFTFLYPGMVSGRFTWMDSYINQIWLNAGFQLAGMEFLTGARSVPFNAAGRAQIEAGFQPPIDAAVNFGAIRSGVALSAAQTSALNTQAGAIIAPTIQTRGWYFQVLDPGAAVRAARGPQPCKFWYTDGQSVQSINLGSVEIQ